MASKHVIRFSYQARIFLVIAVFAWIIAFTFFAVQYTREREYKVELLNTRLQEVNARIIKDMTAGVSIDDKYVAGLTDDDSLRVSIIGLDGNVIYDSNGNVKANHSNRREFIDAVKSGHGYTILRQSETNNLDYFYTATLAGRVVVRTALPYNSELRNVLSINTIYGYIVLIVTMVLTILAFFASQRISKNVELLRDFANYAEKGDIRGYDTDDFPKDELGEISGHIVNLYKNLKHTAEERDKHMQEAMFEESEKNRIKQQMTNNINHELKTPVHAIQACLETIVNNGNLLPAESKDQLIEKSYQNVKRLSALLNDVSMISRVTNAPENIGREAVDLKELISSIVEELKAIYPESEHLKIHTDVPEDLEIEGNVALLESIFKNLMVNSITHSGGSDVYLIVKKANDGFVHFVHYDNGNGVPGEHIERIFERFYRVDEGRSRTVGGTGLGLSIVKNAVLFHGGAISVHNRKEGGLQIEFTLKE